MPRIYESKDRIDLWFNRIVINPKTDCWEIDFTPKGCRIDYPLIKNQAAHRVSYSHFKGEIGDLCVLHRCDNPNCSNPDHLFLGTRTLNMADKVRKNRQQKGSGVTLAKLHEDMIPKIRELRAQGLKQWQIAEIFGVNQSQICRVLTKQRWKHCA